MKPNVPYTIILNRHGIQTEINVTISQGEPLPPVATKDGEIYVTNNNWMNGKLIYYIKPVLRIQ